MNATTTLRRLAHRTYSTVAPTPMAFQVFDRHVKKLQKDRAAAQKDQSRVVDYLKDEVAARVSDRLLDIKREFGTVVDLGAGCEQALNRDADQTYEVDVERRQVDEEYLPFEENSLEAVVSSLSLNWVNDLPGALIQIRQSLKPDGVFIGAMFGGDTLFELRTSIQLAEVERESGISPRVSPMTDSSDISRLLSRAGFTLTTVDVDEIQVNYPSAFELMDDLKAMGESNAVLSRRPFLKRDTLLAAASIYKELHGNEDGTIPATFQVIYMIGWKPSESTPLPKKRGSANASLKDVL
ncbi:hypothetical protein [Absidia glauca]|uniref:Uncharacterized protein n=1 Tax=Absidia glauca TaxID=4829 RepID=A0A168MED6_ABSGL|nr:hypothetical protein [Absidia glauca]